MTNVFNTKRQVNKELDGIQKSMMYSSQRIEHLTRMLHIMNEELAEEQGNLTRMRDEFDRITYNANRNGSIR